MSTLIPNGAPPVGARFTKITARSWTADDSRTGGTHTVKTLCEVTQRDAVGFRYTVIEVLENSDAPLMNPLIPTVGMTGAMAWFGLAAAMTRGDVVPVMHSESE